MGAHLLDINKRGDKATRATSCVLAHTLHPIADASFTSAYFYASRVCQRTQQHHTCQQAGIAPVDRL